MRIAGVSDVSVGYGSPQVIAFMKSIADFYGASAVVFEPDESNRPNLLRSVPAGEVRFERIATTWHPHNHQAGRIEYIISVARRLNKFRPSLLVVFCTYSLPVLFKLKFKPNFVIYYAIESILPYGAFDIEMNCYLSGLVDLIIFPEENRAILDTARCGFHGIPKIILYNCTNSTSEQLGWIPPDTRNGRIIYAGTIDRYQTFAEYFLRDKMASIPLDVFGTVSGWDQPSSFINKLPSSIRFGGHLDSGSLRQLRKYYSYSLIMWNPTNENQLYAAPNKFFESIADGLPPIVAPHPQCRMLVQRYKCGIIMEDWSFRAFYKALKQALKIYGTEMYKRMVEGCRRALEMELNWETQFKKVIPFLKREV